MRFQHLMSLHLLSITIFESCISSAIIMAKFESGGPARYDQTVQDIFILKLRELFHQGWDVHDDPVADHAIAPRSLLRPDTTAISLFSHHEPQHNISFRPQNLQTRRDGPSIGAFCFVPLRMCAYGISRSCTDYCRVVRRCGADLRLPLVRSFLTADLAWYRHCDCDCNVT